MPLCICVRRRNSDTGGGYALWHHCCSRRVELCIGCLWRAALLRITSSCFNGVAEVDLGEGVGVVACGAGVAEGVSSTGVADGVGRIGFGVAASKVGVAEVIT